MTESVSRRKIIPIITSIASVFVRRAMSHKLAHRARLPTSHIKNLAGFILNQRKETRAQQILKQSVESKNKP